MIRSGHTRFLWMLPVAITGLIVPLFWPVLVVRALARVRAVRAVSDVSAVMRQIVECMGMRNVVFWIALLTAAIVWVCSQAFPATIGTCRQVPVYFGQNPVVRDCQPYGTSDLAVVVGLILAVFLLTGDGDVGLTIPGVGQFELKRKAQAAAKRLQEDESLDVRLRGYADFIKQLEADELETPK